MVETSLNLLWLVIVFAAIWQWRFHWTVSRRDSHVSPRVEAVAMLCTLALLFPAISLTDDLHPEIAVVDAASGKRNARLTLAAAPQTRTRTPSLAVHSAVGLLSAGLAPVNFGSARIFLAAEFYVLTSSARRPIGRSPPSLL
jgi:hypothetical protein